MLKFVLLVMSPPLRTADREIFIVNNFSPIPYGNENKKANFFQQQTQTNSTMLPGCQTHENLTDSVFTSDNFLIYGIRSP